MTKIQVQIPEEVIQKALKIYKNKSDVSHFILKSGGKVEFLPKDFEEKNSSN